MASFMVTAKLYGSFILDDDGMAAGGSSGVPMYDMPTSLSTAGYIVSGFLVGFGTSVSNSSLETILSL